MFVQFGSKNYLRERLANFRTLNALKMANSEEEIKMDIMMYVPQLNFTSKSISFMTESKVGLLTCASFLQ